MNEEWLFYPCGMNDKTAFIFFDHGIADTLDDVAGSNLLKVSLAFKAPRNDGLPTGAEFEPLTAMEDDLSALAERHEAHYVGRVTIDGHRYFHLFTDEGEAEWQPRIQKLGERHDYPLKMSLHEDKEHQGYWRDVYPTDDDWQVIADIGVLNSLADQGDDGTTARSVDHWSYFPAQTEADRFAAWLSENGYKVESNGPNQNEEEIDTDEDDCDCICVRFSHETAVTLHDITSHTVALRRQAKACGGDYDGWESGVIAAKVL